MAYVKFNSRPFEGTVNNLVNDIFNELPSLFGPDFNNFERKGSVPANVKESEKAFILELVAPGFEKSDFRIDLAQNLLTVSADKKEEVKTENEKQLRREYSYRAFKRSFTVDDKIDATGITASYINGVLVLNLPKKEAVKASATTIEIK
jgi:HSP20 family protein